MRNFGLAVAVLVVLGSLGASGWKYARNEGWVAGSPASPRPENFKRALDQYLPHTVEPRERLCANIGYATGHARTLSFPDTQFYFSPPTYLARVGPETSPRLRKRLEHFAKHGYLKAAQGDGGLPEFTMTWKGFAASNGAGCLFLAGTERQATVLSHKRARVERDGEEIYEVVVKHAPVALEAWVADPDFRNLFENDGISYKSEIDPVPAVFELARRKEGFRVLGEQAVAGRRSVPKAASDAPPVSGVEPKRLLGLIEAYIARGQGTRNYACLNALAEGSDETTYEAPPAPGHTGPVKTVTFYNFPDRSGEALRPVLLGYEKMRRLESLGLATSRLLAVGEFGRRVAAGGVRFELSPALHELAVPARGCIAIGTVHAEEILVAEKFSAAVAQPRFWARMRLKTMAGREAVAAKFGHVARMQDPGFPVWGTLEQSGSELQVTSLSYYFPEFYVDPAQTRLPIVEALVSPAPPPRVRQFEWKEPKVPRSVTGPLRPNERVIRCGGTTIVCDANDTVVCGGRVVPCR